MNNSDWRLTSQKKHLMNKKLQYIKYIKQDHWNHEHCSFCWDTISEYNGDIHEAYCTIDKNHWICPECFEDFKNMFHWTL